MKAVVYDTSREAQRVLTEAYRAMPPDRKLRVLVPYLETWAESLGVADLLSRALAQASEG